MNSSTRRETYGHRARIGYTCPPLIAEIFPCEFYRLVPDGVTLVITTLTVIERSTSEVDQAYEMSMRAARGLAAAGVDIVFLGGVPVNLSRGQGEARALLRTLAAELGCKVSSSVVRGSTVALYARPLMSSGCNRCRPRRRHWQSASARRRLPTMSALCARIGACWGEHHRRRRWSCRGAS